MSDPIPTWNIRNLQRHLQWAADLEFWTIPFYLTTMHSIKDRSCLAYQLIQSVVYQEMAHVQLVANIANAYGAKLNFSFENYGHTPYAGKTIPHLNFKLDTPNPTDTFVPYSAELGSLDLERINTMCLIEYPEWRTVHQPDAKENIREYGSIGEFYQAVEMGASELMSDLKGGQNQVDLFRHFYNGFSQPTVELNGAAGLKQAANIINAILSQGEGALGEGGIPRQFCNTADDIRPDWQHFKKFATIRELILSGHGPETYSGIPDPKKDSDGYNAQKILIGNMEKFFKDINALFDTGELPSSFGPNMAKVGASILNCWQNGAIPKFS